MLLKLLRHGGGTAPRWKVRRTLWTARGGLVSDAEKPEILDFSGRTGAERGVAGEAGGCSARLSAACFEIELPAEPITRRGANPSPRWGDLREGDLDRGPAASAQDAPPAIPCKGEIGAVAENLNTIRRRAEPDSGQTGRQTGRSTRQESAAATGPRASSRPAGPSAIRSRRPARRPVR